MARPPSSGRIAALVLAVGLGLALLIAIPFRTCPTCLAVTKKNPAKFRVHCPDCGDRGTVTQIRALRGPLIAPQLVGLLQTNLHRDEAVSRMEAVATLAGVDPGEVTGSKYFSRLPWIVAWFGRSEDHDVVLVEISDRGVSVPGQSAAGLVMFSAEGRVLDYVHWGCSSRAGALSPRLVDAGADAAFIEIHASDFMSDDDKILTATYATMWPEPDGSPRNSLTRSVLMKTCRVGLKGDRFTLLFSPPLR